MWSTVIAVCLAVVAGAVASPPATATPTTATPTTPAPAVAAAKEPVALERLFDNRAVSDDTRPGRADFDGAGHSLSAQDLTAAGWTPGRTLALDAARLRWPRSRPGRPDNVIADGQQVALHGRARAVSFLVAASSPDGPGTAAGGTGTIRYEDGSASAYRLRAPDWRGGPLSTKAVALPHLNSARGGQLVEKAKLYAVAVPVDAARPVRSVTLPADPGPGADLHVFALSLRPAVEGWTGSWSASTAGYPKVGVWQDRTVRLVVHLSAGGPRVRIRLENTFASAPVTIGAASVAVQDEGATARHAPVPLRFGGRGAVTIPAGAQTFSDPAALQLPPGADLLVSLHLPGPVAAAPLHSQALQTSYLSGSGSGDRTGERGGGAFTGSLGVWPYLTGVDVQGGPGAVVALGDSITDGVKSTPGANRRWPDVLARRLREQHGTVPAYGVLNHGISANRVVTDRYPGDGISTDTGGVSAGNRLERDVLAQTGARTVVVFEGVNDVRWGTSAQEVIEGLRALAARARAGGLRVVGATITPCGGSGNCAADVEERRQRVNAFIRNSKGAFDAVLDFDRVLRDPEQPTRMRPVYDSGDHLHPGDEGLRALGESVDLRALQPPAGGSADARLGQTSRSTTTGAWSEAPLPLRSSLST